MAKTCTSYLVFRERACKRRPSYLEKREGIVNKKEKGNDDFSSGIFLEKNVSLTERSYGEDPVTSLGFALKEGLAIFSWES